MTKFTYAKSLTIALALLCASELAFADALQTCLDDLTAAAAAKRKAATGTTRETLEFKLVSESELTNRCDDQGNLDGIKRGLRHQIERCSRTEAMDKPRFTLGCRVYARANWCLQTNRRMLEIAERSPDFATFANRVRAEFDWYKSQGMKQGSGDGRFQTGDMQFTGYYTPVIRASRTRQGKFQVPVYSTPPDLVQIPESSPANCGVSTSGRPIKWCKRNANGSYSAFLTRAQIDRGMLGGRGLEIAYIESEIDLAFLQTQGSGTLEVRGTNGKPQYIRANFGGMNGRTNQMLGRIVRCDGGDRKDFGSMEGIRAYFSARPEKIKPLMAYDPSYVFFRVETDGPMGSEGTPVIPRHSLAVDRSLIPPGSAILFDVDKSTRNGSCSRISSFGLAQDTGGAIKGAHVDWYLGTGDEAGDVAGHMNNAGALYVATPKNTGTRVQNCTE